LGADLAVPDQSELPADQDMAQNGGEILDPVGGADEGEIQIGATFIEMNDLIPNVIDEELEPIVVEQEPVLPVVQPDLPPVVQDLQAQ
jgi:hypothetical protein